MLLLFSNLMIYVNHLELYKTIIIMLLTVTSTHVVMQDMYLISVFEWVFKKGQQIYV